MKNIFRKVLLFAVAALLFMTSCEEVINIDFEELNQQIVIDGQITGNPELNRIDISFSQSIYQPTAVSKVRGALVEISDGDGEPALIKENGTGIYDASGINGVPGHTYKLRVEYQGKEYTAISTMPDPITVDSVKFTHVYKGSFPFFQNYYKLRCVISNRPGVEEYCMIKASGGANNYKVPTEIYHDKYSDGRQVVIDNFKGSFNANENITVEFYSMDEKAYEYYRMMKEIAGSDGIELPEIFNMNSYNPKSNLSNNALGFFGAFSYQKFKVTVK